MQYLSYALFLFLFTYNNLSAQDCTKAWLHHEYRSQISQETEDKYGIKVPIEKIQIDFLGIPIGVPFNYTIEEYSPYSDNIILKEEGGLFLHKDAYEYLMRMREAADFNIKINNSYRSYSRQAFLYKKLGAQQAEKPGYSEHHLYTAIDIQSITNKKLLWMLRNAFDFGWIPSYYFRVNSPVKPEAWHWRYVGKLAAFKFRCAWEDELNRKIWRLKEK
jgi:D-alanyl-D-alanine carboxypeptidase